MIGTCHKIRGEGIWSTGIAQTTFAFREQVVTRQLAYTFTFGFNIVHYILIFIDMIYVSDLVDCMFIYNTRCINIYVWKWTIWMILLYLGKELYILYFVVLIRRYIYMYLSIENKKLEDDNIPIYSKYSRFT
ncbi:hypothetical protein ACJX0J_013676 [Zea mays]